MTSLKTESDSLTPRVSTSDERSAMEWLDNAIHRDSKWESVGDEMHRATLKAMLARPVMPEEPSAELIGAVNALLVKEGYGWLADNSHYARTIHRALYAHLTKPATRTVEVEQWAVVRNLDGFPVEIHSTECAALHGKQNRHGSNFTIVRLTGKATVPA